MLEDPGSREPAAGKCLACGGSGRAVLTTCPLRVIPADVWECLDLAELFEKGLAPLAGGTLDQTASFTDAARIVWAEQARVKGIADRGSRIAD
jgi:hypothetical protein